MGEAEDLRRQAKRALRLADSVSDQYAAQGLKALSAKFLERAQILEQDVMPQAQQQRIQPPGGSIGSFLLICGLSFRSTLSNAL